MSDWGAIQRQSHPEYDNYGVLLIGSGGTGKTTFARRLCLNTFSVEVDPTIEEAYCTIVECDGHTVCLDVCDTYGASIEGLLWYCFLPIDFMLHLLSVASPLYRYLLSIWHFNHILTSRLLLRSS